MICTDGLTIANAKVHFIELITHHFKRTAEVTFCDDESMGFLGIKRFLFSPENRAAFDAGMIPSIDGKRQAATGPQIKTLVKIWHTAGFVERVLEGGALSYVFEQATFDRMREQAQRAEEKRRAARSPQHVPASTTTLTPVSERQQSSQIPCAEQGSYDRKASSSAAESNNAAQLRLPPMISLLRDCSTLTASGASPRGLLPPLAVAMNRVAGRLGEGRCLPQPRGFAADSSRSQAGPAGPALVESHAHSTAGASEVWGAAGKRRAPAEQDEEEGCGACKAARRGEASSRAGSQSPPLVPGVISGEDSASDLVQLAMATAAARAAAEAAAAKAAAATAEARAAEAEARAAEAEARAAEAEMRMLEAERQIAGGREAGRLDCCRA